MISILSLFTISCNNNINKENNCIFKTDISLKYVDKLSEIIIDYDFIQLETIEESLIGRHINKIKKARNKYFILYDRKELLIFNNDGSFDFKIDKIGNGPGEYNILTDFDVYNDKIYVLDAKKILVFDIFGVFLSSIPINITGFNIKCLRNNSFLINASGEIYSLYLLDENGNIKQKYFKTTEATRIGSDVAFYEINNNIFFQIGFSNIFIAYNYTNDSFYKQDLICNNNYISKKKESTLIKEYGFDYLSNISMTKIPYSFASYNDFLCLKDGDNDDKTLYFFDSNNQILKHRVSSKTKDDISYNVPFFLFDFLHVGLSEDSFISYLEPFRLINHSEGNFTLNNKFKKLVDKLNMTENIEEENPVLFEFRIR